MAGAGQPLHAGNIAVQTGEQGVLVADTGTGKLAEKVVAAIRNLVGDKPIQFIFNTSFRSDHTGGNVRLHAAGADPSLPGSFFAGNNLDVGVGATIIAHQNVQNRMSAPTGQVAPTLQAGIGGPSLRRRALQAAAILKIDERILRGGEDVSRHDDVRAPEMHNAVAVGDCILFPKSLHSLIVVVLPPPARSTLSTTSSI